MHRLAEHLYSIVITLWVGALWAIGYMAAPTLFHVLDDRALAGKLAANVLSTRR